MRLPLLLRMDENGPIFYCDRLKIWVKVDFVTFVTLYHFFFYFLSTTILLTPNTRNHTPLSKMVYVEGKKERKKERTRERDRERKKVR